MRGAYIGKGIAMAGNTIPKWLVAAVLGMGGAIAAIVVVSYRQPPQAQTPADEPHQVSPAPAQTRAPRPLQPPGRAVAPRTGQPNAPAEAAAPSDGPRTPAGRSGGPAPARSAQVSAVPAARATGGNRGGGKAPIQDPAARAALAFVGADPEAEEVWFDAINDPLLPAEERKDLIEDLNEDGFPDPGNLRLEDLPLIESRIQLIEQLAPDAVDEVNADAFAEAYKDLVNMYQRLTSR